MKKYTILSILGGIALVAIVLTIRISKVNLTINGITAGDNSQQKITNVNLSDFNAIVCEVAEANVKVMAGNNYSIKIVNTDKSRKINYQVLNGKLTVNDQTNRSAKVDVDLNLNGDYSSNTITITLPADKRLSSANIKTDYSNIDIDNITTNTVSLNTQDGTCTIDKIQCDTFAVSDSNGKIRLNNIVSNSVNAVNKNGDIKLSNCSVNNCYLKNDNGAVAADNLTSSGLTVKDMERDISLSGKFSGVTRIESESGKINLKTDLPEKQYDISANNQDGTIYVNGKAASSNYTKSNDATNSLGVTNKYNDIKLDFSAQ